MSILRTNKDFYWVENRENFAKLSFGFTPELDEDLKQLDFIYKKITDKIIMDNYKIFSIDKKNGKVEVTSKTLFEVHGFIKVLVPTTQEVTANRIKHILDEKKCNFNKIYMSFFSTILSDVQKNIEGSIIISHSFLLQCRDFYSCPIDVDPYYLAVYSVNVYGDAVEKIDWELTKKIQ